MHKRINLPRESGFCQWPSAFFLTGQRGWIASLLLVLLATAGCGRSKAPAYNRLPFEITQAFFAAAEKGDVAQADKELKRLQDITPGQPFTVISRREMNLRKRQADVTRLCQQGRLDEARTALREAQQQLGPVPELQALEQTIAALQVVQAYNQQAPFTSSAAATKALAPVLGQKAILAGSTAFQSWLDAQERAVAGLRRRESSQELRQLLQAYDLALISAKGEPDAILRQIAELAPNNPTAESARQLMTLSADQLDPWMSKPEVWAEPLRGLCLELVFAREWPRLTLAARQRLALLELPPEPFSAAGMVLRARLAAVKGNIIPAAAWVERLVRQAPLAKPLVEEGLTTLLFPKDQFQARAWRAPFPSITDYLDRLEQLRQAHP